MRGAVAARMAAILCLVFLPLMIASVGFFAASTWSAGIAFLLLGGFMLLCGFHMARVWDEERT
jgi:hypothetical protein